MPMSNVHVPRRPSLAFPPRFRASSLRSLPVPRAADLLEKPDPQALGYHDDEEEPFSSVSPPSRPLPAAACTHPELSSATPKIWCRYHCLSWVPARRQASLRAPSSGDGGPSPAYLVAAHQRRPLEEVAHADRHHAQEHQHGREQERVRAVVAEHAHAGPPPGPKAPSSSLAARCRPLRQHPGCACRAARAKAKARRGLPGGGGRPEGASCPASCPAPSHPPPCLEARAGGHPAKEVFASAPAPSPCPRRWRHHHGTPWWWWCTFPMAGSLLRFGNRYTCSFITSAVVAPARRPPPVRCPTPGSPRPPPPPGARPRRRRGPPRDARPGPRRGTASTTRRSPGG